MNTYENLLRDGFVTAYIDRAYSSNLAYKPQFISNNHKAGRKVLSSIEDELLSCREFFISVAFIIVQEKIRKIKEKYPVEKTYGHKEKYTEL